MKKSLVSFMPFVLLSTGVLAQTKGNPVDNLPQVNVNKNNTTSISIESKNEEVNASQTITINSFRIQGVKSLDFNKIKEVFEPISRKTITAQELLNAANKVTQMYKKEGYALSFAFVPQQDFKDNIAQIVIVEGYVENIKVTGKTENNDRITHILEELKASKPLRQTDFDRVSAILALQPGLKVNVNIPPPKTISGATAVEAEIIQKKYNISLGLESNNPNAQALLSGTVNSLTSLGDQLTASTILPIENSNTKYYALNYLVPLNNKGTIGKFNLYSFEQENSQPSLNNFGYRSQYLNKSQRASLDIAHPLKLEKNANWFVSGGLYLNKELQTYTPILNNVYPNFTDETQLSVLNLNTSYVRSNEKNATQLNAAIYKGFNAFGAKAINNKYETDFIKLRLQGVQTFAVGKNIGLQLGGIYQFSPDRLSNSEQISFGGRNFGLGYDPGTLAGDKGWGLSAELNYRYATDFKYLKAIAPYVSVDVARAKSNNITLPYDKLSSATIGVRLINQPLYTLGLGASKPLDKLPNFQNKTRLHLELSYQF